jgi:hypothetical protein
MPVQLYSGGAAYSLRSLYRFLLPQPAQTGKRLLRPLHGVNDVLDIYENGAGMIEGTVTVQGAPGRQRVVALAQRGFAPKKHVYSDAVTGRFRLYPLANATGYTILSRDTKTRFNAVVADGVVPVPWEEEEA